MPNWLQSTTSNQLQSIEQFKKSKQEFQASQRRIMETVERNTKKEVQLVEHAINNLNQKVDLIMKTPHMQQEENKMKQSKKLMFLSLQNALKAFEEGSASINQRKDLSPSDKQKYQQALHEKLLEKLYTPEEIDKFKKMFSNIVVVMPKELPRSTSSYDNPGKIHPQQGQLNTSNYINKPTQPKQLNIPITSSHYNQYSR